MSNALAVATVTAVLQDVLFNEIVNAPAPERVDATEVVTAFPGASPAAGGKPRVGIYLYQVTPNVAFRNADLPARPDRIALDLHYLLTFHGDEDALEPQRLLGLAVRALGANAILSRGAIDRALANIARASRTSPSPKRFVAGSDLSRAVERVKITPMPLSLEEMARIWSVFFQTRYALSICYQCSVVVIEANRPEVTPRPVLERRIDVVPFARPVIAQIVSSADEGERIVTSSEVTVLGTDLVGPTTGVLAGGVEVTALLEATPQRIRFTLPRGLRAGIVGVQVVHRFLLGSPPTPHPGVESTPAALLLCPALRTLTRTVTAGASPTTTVTAAFMPAVERAQRVTLILLRSGAGSAARLFHAPPRDPARDPAETTTIAFVVDRDVTAGRYSASLIVDGAESAAVEVSLA